MAPDHDRAGDLASADSPVFLLYMLVGPFPEAFFERFRGCHHYLGRTLGVETHLHVLGDARTSDVHARKWFASKCLDRARWLDEWEAVVDREGSLSGAIQAEELAACEALCIDPDDLPCLVLVVSGDPSLSVYLRLAPEVARSRCEEFLEHLGATFSASRVRADSRSAGDLEQRLTFGKSMLLELHEKLVSPRAPARAKHPGSPPARILRGWKDVCAAIGVNPAQRRMIKTANTDLAGPIKHVRQRPEVREDDLLAWWEDIEGRACAAEAARSSTEAVVEELQERDGARQADLGFQEKRSLNAKGRMDS